MSDSTQGSLSNSSGKKNNQFKERFERWDFIFKVVTTVILVFGTIWGLKEYFDKKEEESIQRKRDYEFMVYKEYKETIGPLCNAASGIVGAKSLKDAQAYISKFETLYYGELAILPNGEMSKAVQSFFESLFEYKNESDETMCPPPGLIEQSLQLTEKCKEMLDLERIYGLKKEKTGQKLN